MRPKIHPKIWVNPIFSRGLNNLLVPLQVILNNLLANFPWKWIHPPQSFKRVDRIVRLNVLKLKQNYVFFFNPVSVVSHLKFDFIMLEYCHCSLNQHNLQLFSIMLQFAGELKSPLEERYRIYVIAGDYVVTKASCLDVFWHHQNGLTNSLHSFVLKLFGFEHRFEQYFAPVIFKHFYFAESRIYPALKPLLNEV